MPLGDWAAALNRRERLPAPWLGTKPSACSAEQDQLGLPPGHKAGREEAGGDAGKEGSAGKQTQPAPAGSPFGLGVLGLCLLETLQAHLAKLSVE